MSPGIVSHEEVLAAIIGNLNGVAIAEDVAETVAVSKSTARRYCEDLVSRGWLCRTRGFGAAGCLGAVEYNVTFRGSEAHENGDRW